MLGRPARAGLGAAIAAIAVALGLALLLARPPSDPGEEPPTTVVVEPGTPLRPLAHRLEAAGVVRSASLFELWARLAGDAGRIQAGTYELPRDLWLPEVLGLLREGRTVLVSVTVPEGLRLEETAGAVARGLGVDSAAFAAAASDPVLAESLGVPAPTLEGYLFPETYRVDPGTDARSMARIMVEHFDATFDRSWRARADALGRSVHEIVTLASIVEGEARVAEERTVIAGVFWNRLERGMRLEADPTVQYALGGHRERVLYRDLEVESPYNTYLVAGLPPGPIASPGRAALEATLWPDSVPYLYFFATGEGGRHTFSETFAEHNRKRRELGR